MSCGDVPLLDITSAYWLEKGTMTFDRLRKVSPSAASGERDFWKLSSAEWIVTVEETGENVCGKDG